MNAAPSLDERLTNSQLSCAATCLRRHQIQYVYGIRPAADAAPLRFGKAWHDALDRRAKKVDLEANVALIRAAYDLNMIGPEERDRAFAYERETLVVLIRLYDWRWSDADSKMQVQASEEPFQVPITNPETGHPSRTFIYAGKIDRRVVLADGRTALEENKTTSDDIDAESDYWRKLRIDTQISRYVLAARTLGHPIDTVLYDVVRKPTIRPSTVALTDADGVKIVLDANGDRVRTKDGKKFRESGDAAAGYLLQSRPETPEEWATRVHESILANPDRHFARQEIPRTNDELREAQEDLWDYSQILNRCQTEDRWPRNPQSCLGYGRCAYIDLCSNGWRPEDGTVPAGFVKVEKHPELAP